MKDTLRLKTTSKTILEKYDSDANRAIQVMESEIMRLSTKVETLKTSTWKPDQPYWEQMSQVVTSCYKPSQVATVFQKASEVPTRTIGKIDESERLQEPVGKQGREIR